MRNQPFSSLHSSPSGHPPEDPRRRVRLLSLGLCTVLLLIGLRVMHVQVFLSPRYVQPWREGIVTSEPLPARDGRIVTRDGVILSQSETRYNVAVDYRWLESPPDETWLKQQVARELSRADRRDPVKRQAAVDALLARHRSVLGELAAVAEISKQEMLARAAQVQQRVEKIVASVEDRRAERQQQGQRDDWAPAQGWRGLARLLMEELTTPPNRFADDPVIVREELADHVLLTHVPLSVAAEIESRPASFPGVHVRDVTARAYPRESLAANIVGVRRPKSSNEEPTEDGEAQIAGESGVERTYDRLLSGSAGTERIERNRRHEIVGRKEVLAPRDGQDLVLTIDSRLQQLAESLLDKAAESSRGGCLVAMDVWTGEILTLAGSPRVSPAILAQPTRDQWQALLDDPRQPLFSRELQMALPPGDLFKVITAAAALESGRVRREESIFCRGYLARPDQHRCSIYQLSGAGHGDTALADALCRSCNVYFFEMARRVSPEDLSDWAERFGLGQSSGIDLPRENAGRLRREFSRDKPETRERAALQLAIGQGGVLATPLQVARMWSALGNGGILLTPRVVRDHHPEEAGQRRRRIEGLHPETLAALREGLVHSVAHPQGNARDAAISMLNIAGMAAAAEVADRPAHAWFAGYAPAEQPRVAVVVVLEHGEQAQTAARIAREFLTEMLGLGELRPAPVDWRDSQEFQRPIDPLAFRGETERVR